MNIFDTSFLLKLIIVWQVLTYRLGLTQIGY